MAGQIDHQWPGPDERQVVDKMLADLESQHWSECRIYIQGLVKKICSDLAPEQQDEVVQEAIISVHHGLPGFRFDSKLTTWLTTIARNRATDLRRKQSKIARIELYPNDSDGDDGNESEDLRFYESRTPEEDYLIRERMEETYAKIEEFIGQHAKTERNRTILHSVLYEGYTCEATATLHGMKAPAVSHIVRSARSHLQIWLRQHPS